MTDDKDSYDRCNKDLYNRSYVEQILCQAFVKRMFQALWVRIFLFCAGLAVASAAVIGCKKDVPTGVPPCIRNTLPVGPNSSPMPRDLW